jgi:hypothetical protein
MMRTKNNSAPVPLGSSVSPMRLLLACAFGGILATQLASCGFAHDETLTGPYRLVAVDTQEEMSICYTLEKGNCVGRVSGTIFSVGWNERFIVAKQHPRNNREVTNYFILEMARDNRLADPSASVTGPLSSTEFEEKAVSLGLPPFTKIIEALK